ncbi:MAG TPA: cytochrome c [Burkholderiales bacterium]|nr:cytochrome c [Burkholderiales bacterium]
MIRPSLVLVLSFAAASALAQGDAKRGEYLAKAGGCVGCHTEEKEGAVPYAGGRALKTPFGTFYGPNITPDKKAGIGNWSEADFMRALREGERPDGSNYFPAFPYPSFTKITDSDARDLWAYLRTLPPSATPSREHDLWFFFGWRWLVTFWKWFYFTAGPFTNIAGLSDVANRGAYLVQALGHCGECHTPRNFLGGPKSSRFLAGGKGPDGKSVANLTPTALKKQSDKEIKDFLVTGLTSEGDVPAEAMGEVIKNTTSQLTPADLDALIAYLRTLPPLPSEKK